MDETNDNITQIVEKIDRSKLLHISSWLVESLRLRLDVERFKEREGDSIRLQYIRAMVQAVQAHNSILKDEELDDIKNRVAMIEAAMEVRK